MKKILLWLIIFSVLLGLSVPSFAYTLVQPPAYYVEPFKDSYILTPKLKTSTMNSKWKSIWNDFVSIYKGNKSGHYLITIENNKLRFFVLSSNAQLKSTTSSKTAFMYIPYDNSFMYLLDFYLPSGDFMGGTYPPDDWGTYLVDVGGPIIKSSLPTTNRKISAVLDLNSKHLYINDDLGMLNIYHNLRINYQYSDGSQAFETYTNTFSKGDSFSIPSPALDGFESSISTISGQMGNSDLNYTVTYTPLSSSSSNSAGSGNTSDGNSSSSGSDNTSDGNSSSSESSNISDGNGKEDYIAFDSETITNSINLLHNNLKPITNIALYGMLVLISIFAALEIIHKIAL